MTQAPVQPQQTDSKKTSTPEPVAIFGGAKESEPAEEKILKDIVEVSEAADKEAEGKISREIKDIRLGEAAPKIPTDVKSAGVVSPQQEASEVLVNGSELDLGISEDTYKKGLHQKIKAAVVDQGVIVGISSLVGMVIWVGKKIKEGHKKALRVVFKRGGENASTNN